MNRFLSPSPNFDERDGQPIDMLVLHYTGMKTGEEALARLCDPLSRVSAHYMVHEDGVITSIVTENMRAWHSGLASWRGHTNINHRSIGIEMVNPGHAFGYRPFPEAQMRAVAHLCGDILTRHDIEPRNIVGHSDVAPTRKEDPGELFDWAWLAEQGIGLFPKTAMGGHTTEKDLRRYGYDTEDMGKAITAFQRHFRPNYLTGSWDNECSALLAHLLSIV